MRAHRSREQARTECDHAGMIGEPDVYRGMGVALGTMEGFQTKGCQAGRLCSLAAGSKNVSVKADVFYLQVVVDKPSVAEEGQ